MHFVIDVQIIIELSYLSLNVTLIVVFYKKTKF